MSFWKYAASSLLIVTLYISFCQAKLPFLSDERSESIEDSACVYVDCLLEEYAYDPMSYENEELVYETLAQMGLTRRVCVRRFTERALQYFRKNAVTIDFGLVVYIVFDEDFFNSLSLDEKKYLIAHEGSHALRLHNFIALFAELYAIAHFAQCVSEYILKGRVLPSVHISIPRINWQREVNLEQRIIGFFLLRCLSRFCEFDADITAARFLNDSRGGCKLIGQWDIQYSYSRYRFKRTFYQIRKYIDSFFSTHPTPEQRIDVLKKFENNKNASTISLLWWYYVDNLKNTLLKIKNKFWSSKCRKSEV